MYVRVRVGPLPQAVAQQNGAWWHQPLVAIHEGLTLPLLRTLGCTFHSRHSGCKAVKPGRMPHPAGAACRLGWVCRRWCASPGGSRWHPPTAPLHRL